MGIVILIAGCSHAPKDQSGTVRLRFSVLGSKQESDLATSLVKKFEKLHPNIRITVEPVAGMGYDAKLVMQSAAETLPDVVWLCDTLVPTFIEYKIVKDLTPFIDEDSDFDVGDIYPKMLKTGMDRDGRVYMLPRDLGTVVMFYNRTLFRRAGLPDPEPDWTHKEFLEMAKKLTVRDKDGRVVQYGFMADYTWWATYVPWVVSAGGNIISEDGKRSALSTPESLRGLHSLIGLVTVHEVALPPNRPITIPGVDPFAAGKVAMRPQVCPQIPFFRASMKQFDWDIQVLPAGPVRRVNGMGASGYGMSRNTKHAKEAWEFLKFIVSPEGQKVFAESGSAVPVLKSMAKDPCWRDPTQCPRNYDAFVEAVEYGIMPDNFLLVTNAEIQDAVKEAFEKAFLRQASVEAAFKEADVKINKILSELKPDGT